MIGRNTKLCQVCLSKITVDYINKYNKIFGGSLSGFVKNAVEHYILNHCVNNENQGDK